MNNKKKIKIEVYSASGFSDLLASPVFYSIATIALVLGFSSIFGFLKAPIKLKSTVDTITEKVMVYQSQAAGREFVADKYALGKVLARQSENNTQTDVLDLLPKTLSNDYLFSSEEDQALYQGIQTLHLASFDYDITSKHFWSDLDIDASHKMTLESKPDTDILMIGVPVEPKFLPKKGDAKYSLKINRNYRI